MDQPSNESAPIALIAMGGHAFIGEGERGTYEDHMRNAETIATQIMTLVEKGYLLAITHGNGPQVGNLLIKQELADSDATPAMPLDVLVAMTEGSLGYILQQNLINQIDRKPRGRYVVTVVTQVVVDPADNAFGDPRKPIGPYLDEATAKQRAEEQGWKVREDARGRWRRVVPSPAPHRVLQRHMIRESVCAGHIVVACGGGGVPVVERADGTMHGVEAVIDKDLTSSVLARDIGAELLIILTATPSVYLEFGTERQRALGAVTLAEVEQYMAEGHFPPGSMGPKIQAVIDFLKSGGRRALITDASTLAAAMEGRGGTHFLGKL